MLGNLCFVASGGVCQREPEMSCIRLFHYDEPATPLDYPKPWETKADGTEMCLLSPMPGNPSGRGFLKSKARQSPPGTGVKSSALQGGGAAGAPPVVWRLCPACSEDLG